MLLKEDELFSTSEASRRSDCNHQSHIYLRFIYANLVTVFNKQPMVTARPLCPAQTDLRCNQQLWISAHLFSTMHRFNQWRLGPMQSRFQSLRKQLVFITEWLQPGIRALAVHKQNTKLRITTKHRPKQGLFLTLYYIAHLYLQVPVLSSFWEREVTKMIRVISPFNRKQYTGLPVV